MEEKKKTELKTYTLKVGEGDAAVRAQLVFADGFYYLLEGSEVVDSLYRNIFRKLNYGDVSHESIEVGEGETLKGIPFSSPMEARNYILGKFDYHPYWINSQTGEKFT